MKHDADQLAEPFWRMAYARLVEQYKYVERLLQERVSDLTEAQEEIDR